MKIRPAITPAALRTGYHLNGAPERGAGPVGPRPPACFEDDEGSATAEWLAHIDAGRIKVR